MPNLNVKGESSKPSAAPGGGGGGTSKVLLTIVIAVVAVGAVLFVLNTTGVVKLWGKKKPVPVVVDVPVENPAPVVHEAAPTTEPQPAANQKNGTEQTKLESNAQVKKTVVTGTGMYTIQIASWPDEKRAALQAQVFQDAGFEAFVEPLGSYFRVCIGRFESKKEARKKAESIEHMLESMYVIAKVGN